MGLSLFGACTWSRGEEGGLLLGGGHFRGVGARTARQANEATMNGWRKWVWWLCAPKVFSESVTGKCTEQRIALGSALYKVPRWFVSSYDCQCCSNSASKSHSRSASPAPDASSKTAKQQWSWKDAVQHVEMWNIVEWCGHMSTHSFRLKSSSSWMIEHVTRLFHSPDKTLVRSESESI